MIAGSMALPIWFRYPEPFISATNINSYLTIPVWSALTTFLFIVWRWTSVKYAMDLTRRMPKPPWAFMGFLLSITTTIFLPLLVIHTGFYFFWPTKFQTELLPPTRDIFAAMKNVVIGTKRPSRPQRRLSAFGVERASFGNSAQLPTPTSSPLRVLKAGSQVSDFNR